MACCILMATTLSYRGNNFSTPSASLSTGSRTVTFLSVNAKPKAQLSSGPLHSAFTPFSLSLSSVSSFSESLSPDQVAALENILPPRPQSQLTDMEIDECEETTLHDVNIDEGPPFTLQRLCEILLSARSIYPKLSKLCLALEKMMAGE